MTRLAIAGAAGRMGKNLIEVALDAEGASIGALIDQATSPAIGRDGGEWAGRDKAGVAITSNLEAALADFDVLIDFTAPQATERHLQICQVAGKAIVIGTTGLSGSQKALIHKAGEVIPVVYAPNMSAGVNLTFKLIEIAAKALGETVDIEIIEAHHRHKVDAPSGTALRMGEIIAEQLGVALKDKAIYGREGQTGARPAGAIGFETIRAGDIVGEHTVMFAGEGERIEITHRATSRKNFAQGAVRAAQWVTGRLPGVYDMGDVLGLREIKY